MWIRRKAALALLAVLGFCLTVRGAGPLDERVPGDAMAYVGWAGADALAEQYANSNAKAILEASSARAFVTGQFGRFLAAAHGRATGAEKSIERVQKVADMAWHRPTAFYFCPVDFSNPNMPVMRLGLMCDAGAEAGTLVDVLKAIVATDPPPAELTAHIVQDGGVVIMTFGQADSAEELKKGGGLAAVPAYQAAMAKAKHAAPAIAAYADAQKGIAMMHDALAKIPNVPLEVKEHMLGTAEALGLTSLTQAAMTCGFEGKGWSQQMFIGVNGPRRGLLALMDGSPLSDGAIAAVPKEASVFSAWKFDLPKVLSEMRNIVSKVNPESQKALDRALAQGSRQLGVNIEESLIAPLGDEWVFYRGPISEDEGSSYALVHTLRDGGIFAKALGALETRINENAGRSPFKIEKVVTGKVEVSTVALAQFSMAWAVKNGRLYVSTLAGIAGAVKQVESQLPSIKENALYLAARAQLPAEVKPLSIGYANPAKMYPELRRLALGVIPLARQGGLDIPRDLLPDADEISPYLTPGASMAWWAADGLHGAGRSAFPGAELLSGQQVGPMLAGSLAVGAANFLPRAAQGPGVEPQVVDAANLRVIAQSALVYAIDHKDQLPDSLATLVAEGMISPRELKSRRARTPALEMTPELQQLGRDDFAKFSEQLEQHTDFVYLGKGMKSDTDAALILAYEKPGMYARDGLNLAFKDAHVEFVPWRAMEETFKKTNEHLRKNQLPPVDVKDLMARSGVGLP